MDPEPSGLRLSVHYALPTTRVFVGVIEGEVVATVSLFRDSRLGLPADRLYRDELNALRDEGRRIGEVGMLADLRKSFRQTLPLVLQMMSHLFWTAKELGLSDLVITVHPKHREFYRRLLCFREWGLQKSYGAVCGAPAVLLRLDVAALTREDVEKEQIKELFFGPRPEGICRTAPYRMQPEDLRYFFLERTDLLHRISQTDLQTIESYYPGLDLPARVPAARAAAARDRQYARVSA